MADSGTVPSLHTSATETLGLPNEPESMSSFVSWVDFSNSDRDRMRKAIALFQEQETRDELGLGTLVTFAQEFFQEAATLASLSSSAAAIVAQGTASDRAHSAN